MTNKEKANMLQKEDVCTVWNGGCPNIRYAAMKMAEWKDEQYKKEKQQLIENACEWLNGYLFYLDGKDDIINNFEQSMKGE